MASNKYLLTTLAAKPMPTEPMPHRVYNTTEPQRWRLKDQIQSQSFQMSFKDPSVAFFFTVR